MTASAGRALAAAIALLTACESQRISTNAQGRTAADSAEQMMFNARTVITSNGVRRGEASGDTVTTFDALTRFQFHPLTVRFSTPTERPLAVLTAPSGVYEIEKSTLQANGPVTLVSDTTRRRIEARWVRYDAVRNQLASDSAFTATSGARRLTGVGFTTDPGLFSVKCLQQCAGSLSP
jgi:LPS export ABC transporter protein LptC